MIAIRIDERACVGCSLCVDICPTDVFRFDEDERVPVVGDITACFGCLSCSEICPSDAIDHDHVKRSVNFYHDEYALQLASKLGLGIPTPQDVSDDPVRQKAALDDLGVRLVSMAAVLEKILGHSLPAVGTIAGKTLATQLPRYCPPENLQETLDLMVEQFQPAWEIDFTSNGDEALTIEVGNCFVRDVCHKEGIPLGGGMCILFYHYLAGYLSKMSKAWPRLQSAQRGDERCSYHIKVRQR